MYKKATRIHLRIQTKVGNLGIEDLWSLPLESLNTIAKGLRRSLKSQEEEEDFLRERSKTDTLTKLKFDIVLDILNTKKEELKIAKEASANKVHNQKILKLIADKQNEELSGKSIDELEKLLK